MSAISFRDVSFAYPDATRAALRDVDLDVAPGELLLVRRRVGVGQEHAAARGERARAAHQRRPLRRRRRGVRALDARRTIRASSPTSSGSWPRTRGAVRRRPRRARPRVRAREPRVLAGGDAPAGRGGARRARHRAPARPRPVDALGRRAPAVRDRRCARRRTAGARARRAHVAARPAGRRRRARRARCGSTTTSARPWCSPSTAWSAPRRWPTARCSSTAARVGVTRRSVGDVLATYPGAPSVTRLGRLLGWDPLPLTVRDARARAALDPPTLDPPPARRDRSRPGDALLHARDLRVALGGRTVVRGVDLELRAGDVDRAVRPQRRGQDHAAARARRAHPAEAGTVDTHGARRVRAAEPERDAVLVDGATRAGRDATAPREDRRARRSTAGSTPSTSPTSPTATRAASPAGSASASRSPRWRSAARPCCCSTSRPAAWTHRRAPRSSTRCASTPPPAARSSSPPTTSSSRPGSRPHAVVLGDGEIVADGDARTVLAGSLFAPQVLRVLPPFLTVEEVDAELARS